jgi:hypothetical protein
VVGCRGEVVAVPLLDAAQIDVQRRGGAREAADQGGRKVGRGGEEGGRWQKGEREAARQGRGGGGRLRLVEKWRRGIRVSGVNIYKHHDECRPSDREIDSSQRPRCWWANVKVGHFKVGLCGITFSFFFFFYCTIVK